MDHPIISIIRDRMASWLGFTHNGNRDLYQQFGWFKVVSKEQLFAMYNRNAVANRIIRLYPQATWREKPVIRDEAGDNPNKKEKNYSAFAEAVDKLFKDHRIFHFLERGDRVASIGQFGCLLLGFQDGKKMEEPLERGTYKLLYIQPYSELNITVNRIDDDPRSPRFGKPLTYTLQAGGATQQGLISTRRTINAHWTRVIHLAEFLDEDNVYGVPRLLPVFNYLQDLDKILGASTETYWLNARAGLSLEADKDVAMRPEQLAAARKQAIEYEHQLRRVMALQGMKANQLDASTDDPASIISGLLDSISGGSGIPKRILIGSERGELASSQDENNWAQRVEERRHSFAMPMVLEPLIERLLITGNLPEPKGEWWVEWGGKSLTPEQQTTLGASMSTSLRNYLMSPGADILVPPSEFRSKFLGLPPNPEVADDELDLSEAIRDEQKKTLEMQQEAAPALPKPGEEDKGAAGDKKVTANTKVAPLYVCRPVVNAPDIIAWAEQQGIDNIVPADKMHVTLLYSDKPVDWMAMGNDVVSSFTVPPGGPRLVEEFGEGALVLSFVDESLIRRHKELLGKGASANYAYAPHVTISYENGLGDLDIDEIQPYKGEIVLGPEVFENINTDFKIEVMEEVSDG